jgi:hypothetical protein
LPAFFLREQEKRNAEIIAFKRKGILERMEEELVDT